MADNQFQGSLYRTQRDMLDSIAYAWLTSQGRIGDAERRILAEETDEALTAECIEGWELNVPEDGWPGDDEKPSHMAAQNYDEADLRNAFARLREGVAKGEIE
jgi:hypothetical protein